MPKYIKKAGKNKRCDKCSKEFNSSYPNKAFCSPICRKEHAKERVGRIPSVGLSTGTIGATSELMAAADLMLRGYSVFRALSPACFCDLIATKNGQTLLIEVRTGYLGKEKKLTFTTKCSGNITHFAVYERNNGVMYYLDKNRKPTNI